jgi:hypothetical protein
MLLEVDKVEGLRKEKNRNSEGVSEKKRLTFSLELGVPAHLYPSVPLYPSPSLPTPRKKKKLSLPTRPRRPPARSSSLPSLACAPLLPLLPRRSMSATALHAGHPLRRQTLTPTKHCSCPPSRLLQPRARAAGVSRPLRDLLAQRQVHGKYFVMHVT